MNALSTDAIDNLRCWCLTWLSHHRVRVGNRLFVRRWRITRQWFFFGNRRAVGTQTVFHIHTLLLVLH